MLETAAKQAEEVDPDNSLFNTTSRNVDELIKKLNKDMEVDGEDEKIIHEEPYEEFPVSSSISIEELKSSQREAPSSSHGLPPLLTPHPTPASLPQ